MYFYLFIFNCTTIDVGSGSAGGLVSQFELRSWARTPAELSLLSYSPTYIITFLIIRILLTMKQGCTFVIDFGSCKFSVALIGIFSRCNHGRHYSFYCGMH